MGKQVTRYRVCDECQSEDGVRTNKVTVNGHKYDIDTCPEHADELEDDLRRWTDIGTKTGEPSIFDTPREAVRLVLDAEPRYGPTPAMEPEREKVERVAEMPPTAERWTLTEHALQRMAERGFNIRDVLWAAEEPETSIPNPSPTGQAGTFSHSRGDCVVIVDPDSQRILTVKYSQKHPLSDNYKKVGAR